MIPLFFINFAEVVKHPKNVEFHEHKLGTVNNPEEGFCIPRPLFLDPSFVKYSINMLLP